MGNVMRELTSIEIDRLDFTGQIPELNVASPRVQKAVSVKNTQRQVKLNIRPAKKRRWQLA